MNLNKVVCQPDNSTGRAWFSVFFTRVLVGYFLLWALPGRAVPPPVGTAPVISPAGGLALDGNVFANTPDAGIGDWVFSTNFPGAGAGVLSLSGVPLDATKTFHVIDPYSSTADLIFAGGLKWTDDPNGWQWATGKPSSKTEINNALIHVGRDVEDHIWVAVAADRLSTSGDSYIDFEFLQSTLTRNTNNSSFVSAGPHGGRTVNDVLLSLAFTGGGKVADFFAWSWQTNNSGGYAYVDVTASLPVGRVFVALNSNTIALPYSAFGLMSYPANAFAEASVDLTTLLGNFDQCLTVGFKTIMIKTKSSASSSASIEDFIDPIQYNLRIGPRSDAGPDQTRCTEGASTVFPLNGIAAEGHHAVASNTWSVVDGTVTIDSPTSLITTAIVSSATATLRLTVVQTNGCTATDDIVLKVAPLPVCSITGVTEVCPDSLTQFQAPAGMNAYSWSVSGNATISGATNARTVTVKAGLQCGMGFTLGLTVVSNSCSSIPCSTEVLVNDTTAPSLVCPPDRVLECPADTRTNITGIASAQDGCGQVFVSYSDQVTAGCAGTKTILRTWTATDLCGNSTNCTQTITVRDTVKPTIVCPSNRVLECPADTGTNNTGVATAQDACGLVTITYSDSISNSCGGTMTITRTWLATDECGNATSCPQTITVRDTTRPSFILPPNLTIDCPADVSTNNTGLPVSTDTCGSVTLSYTDSVTNKCGATMVIARRWTAVDQCGNSTNGTQTITVRDISQPIITCPPDAVLECPADTTTNNTGVATAQDACSQVSIRFTDSVTNKCGNTKVIARTWTATDQCSNSVSCVQLITVRDTIQPALTCPPDVGLECPADTRTNVTGVALAQDGCGAVTIRYGDVVTTNCGGTKVIARTWTATDACSNVTSCVQTITVRDTTPPTITCPTNRVLECPANTATNVTGVATAQDACGGVSISYLDSVTNNCGGTKIIARTWTAIDACGNASSCVQTITVRDTTKPTITCPTNVVLECPADTSTNNTGVATTQDSCGAATVSYSDSITNNCGGTRIIARTWTALDECGNSASCVQTITVRDTTKPTITCPPNVVLECPADTSTNATGMATAQDACGTVTITYTDSVTNNCGGTKVIARTWRATDQCGNFLTCVQTITVRDTTPPTISCPANIVLECPAVTTTNVTGVATAQDGCGSVTIGYSDSVTNNCGGTKVIKRTWTATDACSNVSTCVQTITVRDTTPPVITCPTNRVLECPGNPTTNVTGVATAQDGCGTVTIGYSDSITNNCGGTRIIARTWTATDSCGNTSSCVQTITVRDTTSPTISCPPNVTLDCPANTSTNATGVATAQDGCGSTTITFSDSVTNNCAGTKVIARTWRATDACGNTASCVQTITVRDITPPTIVCPTNLVLECPANTGTNATGIPIAQDACGSVVIGYTDSITNKCGGTKVISRLWTATDLCGNSASCLQTITVRDTTPPTITCPANVVLECPANTSTNLTGVATAQDACGTVIIGYNDFVTNNCGGSKIISRVWTATDQCGNSANCAQTITVRDTLKPVLTIPTNVVLECPAQDTSPNVTGRATALDACAQVVVNFTDAVSNGCGATKVITRTWIGTDECGNTATGVQTITVRDTIKPSLVVPANLTLECPANTTTNNTGVATAQDTCGSVTLIYSDSISNSCGGARVISRLWTATDACGNATNKVQSITLIDTRPPTITAPPSLVLDCPANTSTNNTGVATTQDACSAITLSYSDIVTNGCGGTKVISRTWTARDACGNSVSALQTITLRDITPPSLTVVANVVQQCPGDTRTNVTGVASTTDACGSVTLTYSDVVTNGCGMTRTVQRLWTATDQCGNTTNKLQIISVIDTTKPTFVCPNKSVQCVADIPAAYTNLAAFRAAGGTATDACSTDLSFALVSDSGLVGRCPGTVTRVYRVTDDCGNIADCTQRITVDDTIAPTIICPTNLTLEAGNSLDTNHTGVPTVTDNCSTPIITYTNRPVTSEYAINFYAADCDVNTGPYGPTYMKFSPATLPCPTSAIQTGRALDPLRNAVAYGPTSTQLDALTSLAGEPMALGQIVPFEAVILMTGAPGPERGIVEFSATWATHTTSNDRFGFDTNYMVYCAFVDAADPGYIDPRLNAKVEHISSTIINRGQVDEQILGTFRVSGLDVGDKIIVEIWMVLDSVQPGNVGGTIAAQLVSAAKFLYPEDPVTVGSKTISIGNLNKMTTMPPPQQQPPLGPLPPQPPTLPGETLSVTDRIWRATDDCGNTATCTQRITVRDTQPPLLSLPTDLILECPADTSTNNTGSATAPDLGGGSVVITYSDSVTNGCGVTKVISRRWTATDSSGNTTNAVQTIAVNDTIAPTLTSPPDVVLECPAGDTTTANTGIATAQDSCGSASVNFTDLVTDTCGNTKIISRTWTATDVCGNVAQHIQTITVRDSIAPVITCPPNLTLECPANIATANTGVATAQDNCGSASVSYTDSVAETCGGAKVVTRIWVATDECGNSSECRQTITVRDTTPPALACKPSRTIEPGVPWTFADPTASDTCGSVTVQVINTTTNKPSADTLAATRTWQATDSCGNMSLCQQTITVLVGPVPTVTSQPLGQTVVQSNSFGLTVTANSTGPYAYQWRLNGTNIAGATGTAFNVSLTDFTNAGLYSVVVSNASGVVTSKTAVVNVAPKLFSQWSPNMLRLQWSAPFVLQSATNVTGPYLDVPGATSPYLHLMTDSQRFFRLRSAPFPLLLSQVPGNNYKIEGAGVPGCNFVIQASTNLQHWVNLHTNLSPFSFIDSNAWQHSSRFYRATLAH